MSDANRDEAFEATVAALAEAPQGSPNSTIEPPATLLATGRAEALVSLRAASGPRPEERLRMEGTLGQGGMALVRLAEQASLGRKVAVKTVRADHRDEQSIARLLSEAWVTGALEHPNVVPVYDLDLAEDGTPSIILKRIEGEDWSRLIANPKDVRERFGEEDLEAWNLRILVQVCHGVEFAHSRGIVHRDLKPANVMIGSFGEVYVLDWGIAVSLRDDGGGRLPLASRSKGIAGTPAYMAPELLQEGGEPISERTDVYLLGATLHEILTGEPPHVGADFAELVRSIRATAPALPEGAPPRLSSLCRRAMALDPAARPATIAAFRRELEAYVQHRGAIEIAERAQRRLDELAQATGDDTVTDDAQHRLRLHSLFSECRFGFQESLKQCAENPGARAGLRTAVETMVRYELAANEPGVAAALLAELEEAPPELRAEVERALRARDAEQRRAEALARDIDPMLGKRTRFFVTSLMGAIWTLVPLILGPYIIGRETDEHSLSLNALLLVISGGLTLWARDSMSKTQLNRSMVFAAMVAFQAMTMALNVPVATTLVLFLHMWFVCAAWLAVTVERWLVIPALGYLAAGLLAAFAPEWRYQLMAASNLVLGGTFAVLWYPGRGYVPRGATSGKGAQEA